ncbi:TcpE family conjugal transfer membrane protein [uncultured Lactococcus sp.]|uniref:TcpE family conjugal transfer membrane protein n=1 Tax=uncultured Lactococcus sp. TaxID=167973 RepID=UPI0027DD4B64|nr:TcpE family conjugal transfer membrane protein [uncultured Lactococcus sp.]
MMRKEYYDYVIGLETPYWVQEIRLRGKVYWTFQTPMSVPFILVMFGSAGVIYILIHPLFPILNIIPMVPVAMLTVLPWWLGKKYVSVEPDGKKMHQYISGTYRFVREFGFDKRGIYQEERRKEVEEKIVFEKVKL